NKTKPPAYPFICTINFKEHAIQATDLSVFSGTVGVEPQGPGAAGESGVYGDSLTPATAFFPPTSEK
ncbi:MAG: hypothetical protein AAGK98_18220, partial [Pseudomonadota bacterium]